MKTVALIAHDNQKNALIQLVKNNLSFFLNCKIISTGTTGKRIIEHIPELNISPVQSGPLGGDLQIGSMIVEEKIDALFFLWDPLSPQPHDVDVKALLRIAVLKNIFLASNIKSAQALINELK